MCGLFQPTCQVRYTNVATVRLKLKGERFEIACYKNKVVNWRSGVENDIHEVLQSPYIFTSISKGKLANNAQLMNAFKTTDVDVIIKQILDKGEFQISKEEREQLLKSTFNDIITILHEITINPQTGYSLSRNMLENALKSSGFSVSLNKSTKIQSLKALHLLQLKYPNIIQRCKMKLKLNFLPSQSEQTLLFINSLRTSNNSSQDDSSATSDTSVCKDNVIIESKKDDNMIVMCLPSLYKNIENFVQNELDPPGNVQLVTLNIKQEFDHSTSEDFAELEKLQLNEVHQDDVVVPEDVNNKAEDLVVTPTNNNNKDDTKKMCNKCNIELEIVNYKSHYKSNYHLFNVKRTLNNEPPISLQEYNLLTNN